MTYYIFVKNEEIIGCGQAKCIDDEILNMEVEEELYNSFVESPNKYVFKNGEIVLNPNYEEELALKEKERIAKLFLTSADVERGIYQAKGMDFDDIVEFVTQLQAQEAPQEGEPIALDIKALKIELKANNFYRGNPYVSAIGALLGFTDEQLDLFFETNDYTVLLPKEDEVE